MWHVILFNNYFHQAVALRYSLIEFLGKISYNNVYNLLVQFIYLLDSWEYSRYSYMTLIMENQNICLNILTFMSLHLPEKIVGLHIVHILFLFLGIMVKSIINV